MTKECLAHQIQVGLWTIEEENQPTKNLMEQRPHHMALSSKQSCGVLQLQLATPLNTQYLNPMTLALFITLITPTWITVLMAMVGAIPIVANFVQIVVQAGILYAITTYSHALLERIQTIRQGWLTALWYPYSQWVLRRAVETWEARRLTSKSLKTEC